MRVGNESKPFAAHHTSDVDTGKLIAAETRPIESPQSGKSVQPVQGPSVERPFEPSIEAMLQRMRLANFGMPVVAMPFAIPAQLHAALPAAGLKSPKPEIVKKLAEELDKVRKAAESGEEKDRAAVDVVLKKVADAYGIGLDALTGLEFDPRLKDQGGTIGTPGKPRTFVVIGKSALESPEVLASTILHESSHAQRNKQLADAGIDRDSLNLQGEAAWSAIIEVEGYQIEIDNAKKLGTSDTYVKGARSLQQGYLRELENAGGKPWRELAEKGKFDELRKKFIEKYKTK